MMFGVWCLLLVACRLSLLKHLLIYFFFHFCIFVKKITRRPNDAVIAFEKPRLSPTQEEMLQDESCPGLVYMALYNCYTNDGKKFTYFGVPLMICVPFGSMNVAELKLYVITQLLNMGIFGKNRSMADLSEQDYKAIDIMIAKSNKNGKFQADFVGTNDYLKEDATKMFDLKARKVTFVSMLWGEDLFDLMYGSKDKWGVEDLQQLNNLLPCAGDSVEKMSAAERKEEQLNRKKPVDIHQCLSDFSKPETLDRDNLW